MLIPLFLKTRASYVHYTPRGVVGIISPWNFPFALPICEVLMALIAGNGVARRGAGVHELIRDDPGSGGGEIARARRSLAPAAPLLRELAPVDLEHLLAREHPEPQKKRHGGILEVLREPFRSLDKNFLCHVGCFVAAAKTLIETHEGAALVAFIFMEITGAVAWLALWQFASVEENHVSARSSQPDGASESRGAAPDDDGIMFHRVLS